MNVHLIQFSFTSSAGILILTTSLALSYGISQKSCFLDLKNTENKHCLDTGSLYLAEPVEPLQFFLICHSDNSKYIHHLEISCSLHSIKLRTIVMVILQFSRFMLNNSHALLNPALRASSNWNKFMSNSDIPVPGSIRLFILTVSCIWGNEFNAEAYCLHVLSTDPTEVTKLGIFHNEVLTQYLLFEKVFHLSQYLVHLHHLIHQLPIKITCRETATEEYTMNNIFSFVIIVSEMQDGNILKAKKATHCCCLSPVATLRANTVSNFKC